MKIHKNLNFPIIKNYIFKMRSPFLPFAIPKLK